MDCKTIESLLQGYLDGEVSKEEKDSVLLHLKGCPSCQKEVEWSERVREHFQVERELPPGFRADLYVRMDSAGSPSRVRLLWAGGLAVLLLLLSIPFVNRTVFFPSDRTPRIHVVSPLEDEVLSGEGMDICAAFYPAIEKRSGIEVWIDEEEVTGIAEISQDYILLTKSLEEGYHRVTVKLEDSKGRVQEELSWTFYTL